MMVLKEGENFIAYSPAVDLSAVGESFEKAQENFKEIISIFFEELVEKGTLEEVLSELGWEKKKKNLTPPVVVSSQMQQFSLNQPLPFAYA